MSKVPPSSAAYISLSITVVNALMTFPPIFLIGRLGKKTVLYSSMAGILISLVTLGYAINSDYNILSSVPVITFVASVTSSIEKRKDSSILSAVHSPSVSVPSRSSSLQKSLPSTPSLPYPQSLSRSTVRLLISPKPTSTHFISEIVNFLVGLSTCHPSSFITTLPTRTVRILPFCSPHWNLWHRNRSLVYRRHRFVRPHSNCYHLYYHKGNDEHMPRHDIAQTREGVRFLQSLGQLLSTNYPNGGRESAHQEDWICM